MQNAMIVTTSMRDLGDIHFLNRLYGVSCKRPTSVRVRRSRLLDFDGGGLLEQDGPFVARTYVIKTKY